MFHPSQNISISSWFYHKNTCMLATGHVILAPSTLWTEQIVEKAVQQWRSVGNRNKGKRSFRRCCQPCFIVRCCCSVFRDRPVLCDVCLITAVTILLCCLYVTQCSLVDRCQSKDLPTEDKGGKFLWNGDDCLPMYTYDSWFQTFAFFWILYGFFWVIPWRPNFICQRFEHSVCSIRVGG